MARYYITSLKFSNQQEKKGKEASKGRVKSHQWWQMREREKLCMYLKLQLFIH